MTDESKITFKEISEVIRGGKYPEALEMLNVYENAFPNSGDKAALLRAQIASDLGEHNAAVAILSRALSQWPDALALRYELCCYLTDAQQWELAKEMCDILIADSLRLEEPYFLMDARVRSAWCSVQMGLMDEAKEKLASLNADDSALTDNGFLTVQEILSKLQ